MSNGLLKLIAAILIASALFSCAKGDDPTKIKQSLEVAALSVQDITQYDFGPVLLEGTLNKTFTLVNTGRIAATNITGQFAVSAFNFKGGSFPGTGGSCSSTIAAGTACTIVVSFLPTYCSSFRDNLALTYFDGRVVP